MEALITEYGWAILKGSGMIVGLILALLRVKKWINDADEKQTVRVVKDTMEERCPIAQKSILEKFNALEKTVKDNAPNGELEEIKGMLADLTKAIT